jgi:site-specific recombinase XerD
MYLLLYRLNALIHNLWLMRFVEPIREIKKIAQIKNMLKWANQIRDLLLFELWINAALRISDLLSIQVKDVFDETWAIRDYFDVIEAKTGKTSRITITNKVRQTLALYYQTYASVVKNQSHYLFFNQRRFPLWGKSLTRKMWWRLINKRCTDVWLKGRYGGHSLRKTWAYQWRMASIPLELIMHRLNHSSVRITQKYLGITNDELEAACNKLDL